jgi:DNA-binding NarL/FixJ family response regulator
MKKHPRKSNRNQPNKTASNHTNKTPESGQAPERALATLGRAGTPSPRPARSDQPSPRRIALVESDPDSILTIEKILQSAAEHWRFELHSRTEQALREIPAQPPDVVLLATGLPGLPTTECVHRLKVLTPTLPVLILSADPQAPDVIRCLAAGASGHLVKPAPADELISALHHALQGNTFLCRHTLAMLANHFRASAAHPPTRRLTPREEEVLGYVGQGLLNKEIADKLHISTASVHAHIANIFTRLDVHDRHAACRIYQEL